MRYPKTQKGNRHGLTIAQHIFPRRSLERFADESDGLLAVRRPPGTLKERRMRPNADLFCAMRVWDHSAESGFMREIESKFQAVANEITATQGSLAEEQHDTVTNFYALWCARADLKAAPIADRRLPGIVRKERHNSLDDQETLEKNGILYINENLTLPGRMLASAHIWTLITSYRKSYPGQHWGVVSAHAGEFIVPDQFGGRPIVPVTPTVCLIANHVDLQASEQQVRQLNNLAVEVAREYVLARSFAACPT
jgi:hypothetical protein